MDAWIREGSRMFAAAASMAGWIVVGIVGLFAAGYAAFVIYRSVAVIRFRIAHTRRGKDLLLVYSNSPRWQEYIERNWFPKWGERAVILNWSERRKWANSHAPEIALFRTYSGRYEINPLAIVVPRRGPVHVVRFYQAFRDFQHGSEAALRIAERQLEAILNT